MPFRHYFCAKLVTGWLCCFKEKEFYQRRAKMLDRYEELKSRLSHEIDLVEMV